MMRGREEVSNEEWMGGGIHTRSSFPKRKATVAVALERG